MSGKVPAGEVEAKLEVATTVVVAQPVAQSSIPQWARNKVCFYAQYSFVYVLNCAVCV